MFESQIAKGSTWVPSLKTLSYDQALDDAQGHRDHGGHAARIINHQQGGIVVWKSDAGDHANSRRQSR